MNNKSVALKMNITTPCPVGARLDDPTIGGGATTKV